MTTSPGNPRTFVEAVKTYGLRTTPFHYEAMPVLQASTTPQQCMFGTDDLDTLAVYPGAEHGMTLYELNAHGERLSTRFALSYFEMMADFIRNGRISDVCGQRQNYSAEKRRGTST